MMPNLDPRTMKNLMAKMGIKTSEIEATRVIIESNDKNIIISNPQVTEIEAQGIRSFQISGEITESEVSNQLSISDDDINIVSEKTGITDKEHIKKALQQTNGNIAEAILLLQNE
ncbi:MAG: nascent polypeptide-associated complex protein [Candidatus Micrarchaeia archaeon]